MVQLHVMIELRHNGAQYNALHQTNEPAENFYLHELITVRAENLHHPGERVYGQGRHL
jgi:hypothetical protein